MDNSLVVTSYKLVCEKCKTQVSVIMPKGDELPCPTCGGKLK